jgi:signal transduction histidine kinase
LAELCAQVIGELQLTHPQWSITCDVQGEVEGMWDPDRLLQALSNLVANAGQHGKDACPISIRLDGLQPDVVKFEVHNEGAIPASLQANLFDPFRTRRADSRGLGLGLYIVKEIVVMHGGTIDVASSDSSGTTFIVYLPRHARSRFPTHAEADV